MPASESTTRLKVVYSSVSLCVWVCVGLAKLINVSEVSCCRLKVLWPMLFECCHPSLARRSPNNVFGQWLETHVGKNIMTWFLGISFLGVWLFVVFLWDGQQLQVSKSIVNTWNTHFVFFFSTFFLAFFVAINFGNWFLCVREVFYFIVMIILPLQSWLNFGLMTALAAL